eukprot:COSAG01_NODE_174_length_23022_cov_528.590978_8_plen_73_part_00
MALSGLQGPQRQPAHDLCLFGHADEAPGLEGLRPRQRCTAAGARSVQRQLPRFIVGRLVGLLTDYEWCWWAA